MEHQAAIKTAVAERQNQATCSAKPDSKSSESISVFRKVQEQIGNRALGLYIQAKLTVSTPGDAYEQEADRVADQVMRMPDRASATDLGTVVPTIQRACAECEEEEINRKEESPEEDEELNIQQSADPQGLHRSLVSPYSIDEGRIVDQAEETVQTKSAGSPPPAAGVAARGRIDAATSGSGTMLPNSTRTFLESRFQHDFGGVQIHADEAAAQAAESVNARAFTLRNHVVFGRGQYAPDSEDGRRLLAHEFTHVIQQASSPSLEPMRSGRKSFAKSQLVNRRDPEAAIQRIKWNTIVDTGRDSFPWRVGPSGDVYRVETDAGTLIDAWKPHDGQTYWCHGYTFGGFSVMDGPFSIWGQDVPTVLNDDGWQRAFSCMAGRNEILVFSGNNVAHSGLVDSVGVSGGTVDENTSMLDSKWGQAPLNVSS